MVVFSKMNAVCRNGGWLAASAMGGWCMVDLLLSKESNGNGKSGAEADSIGGIGSFGVLFQPKDICKCESMAALQTRGELIADISHQQPPSPSSATNSAKLAKPPAFNLKTSYDLQSILGEGAYGQVYHAIRKSDGKSVAIKAMPREYTGQTDFEREVAALQLLSRKQTQHTRQTQQTATADATATDAMEVAGQDRIVQLYDLHRDAKNYYLVMEFIDGGELFDHLVAGGPFSEGLAASFLRQFAEGLSYTHHSGLVHGDLKPENLLLATKQTDNGTEETSLKLVDFGCACTHDSSKKDMQQLPIQEFAAGCSFLHMVALGNQFELERLLMEKPTLVNFRDYDFRTPLHLAASEGHVDICRFLVAKGARINRTDRWGGSPLDDAHREQHREVVAYLREQGARFGNSATAITKFIEAASAGDVDEVKALLDFGTMDLNQGDYDQRTALHLACSEGRLSVVELLVREGADVNVDDRWGNKPIDDARRAKKNSKQIVSLLKANGAVSSKFRPFASQRTKKSDKKSTSSTGTVVYWPPEMFVEGASPAPPIDMWSAGVIMYIVLTGSHPFDKYADKTNEEVTDLIVSVGSAYRDGGNLQLLNDIVFDDRVEGLSDSCIDLMKKLMHPDPKQRMTSEDFLRHPWIQGLTASWKLQINEAHKKLLKHQFRSNILRKYSYKGSIRDIFNAIDFAHNGVLDANEIRFALRDAGEPEEVVTKIVNSLDFKSHGGRVQGINFDEFQKIMNLKE